MASRAPIDPAARGLHPPRLEPPRCLGTPAPLCRPADHDLTAALDDYRRHAERYGPELVVETAAHDLEERELAELRSYVQHLERTKRWHRGRWHDTRVSGRPCESCGLDLPANASPRMRLHAHCRGRLKKCRQRERARMDRSAAQGGDSVRSGRSLTADRGSHCAGEPAAEHGVAT